ncbi:MAG: PilZ domain-containing protein [Proteobacteria bacterium]|nr:PilZ domain-containing protein [Pseudomonadota bacterium]MBU1710855.1 PilZ domain-containing protein [Pseudomonadota bacterium]
MNRKDSPESFLERRQHQRVGKDFEIRYGRFEDLHTTCSAKTGKLIDIGGGGLRFLATELLESNTPLVMTLDLFGWSPDMDKWAKTLKAANLGELKVLAMVVRGSESRTVSGAFEIGVRFSGSIK